jgi:thiol-disulfide isomerase/thioredoxin
MARKTNARRHAEQQRRLEEERRRNRRSRLLRTMGIGGAAVAALILLLVLVWPEPAVGNTSRDAWDLPQLDGEGRVKLADFQGKPTVAAFFASWCTVCEDEIPQLLALSEQIGDRVNFVGINSQDNGRGLPDAEKWGIAGAWPLAADIGNGNGSALSVQSFGARGSPTNVIYDENGEVVHVQLGGIAPSRLVDLLTELTSFDG